MLNQENGLRREKAAIASRPASRPALADLKNKNTGGSKIMESTKIWKPVSHCAIFIQFLKL